MTRAEVGPDGSVKCQCQFGPKGRMCADRHVSVHIRRARIKSFLIFSYIGCGKGTKNGTENPSGIRVYNGCKARFARAYEKAN